MRVGRAGVAGACAAALLAGRAAADPAVSGAWGPLTTWPVSGTHAILLPTGKVLVIGEFEDGVAQYLWDPSTGALRRTDAAGYNVFCAGHSRLADGRVLFTGGHADMHVGIAHAAAYDPATGAWDHLAPISSPRWYPTNVTLASGDVVTISGEIGVVPDPLDPTGGDPILEEIPELYSAATDSWRRLDGARQRLTYYPWCFVPPRDPRVFCVNQNGATFWLDVAGAGRWTRGPWSANGERRYGSPALVGSRVFITGGGIPPTATVEVLDLAERNPGWRPRAPMTSPRRQHNATILPDGSILVTGGTSGALFDDASNPVLHAEAYDPDADRWTPLAPAAAYRGYHSTSLLLPDGRVLNAGGRNVHTAQVFSPPYLFRGPRPRISKAPATLSLGQVFRVETPDGAAVRKVALIRLGAVTHSYDEDQRFVPLAFESADGALRATAPASNAIAPPGDYMLFLVNSDGVPSEAAMVRLGQREWDGRDDGGGGGGGGGLEGTPEPPVPPKGGGGCSTGGTGAGVLAALLIVAARSRARARPPARARTQV